MHEGANLDQLCGNTKIDTNQIFCVCRTNKFILTKCVNIERRIEWQVYVTAPENFRLFVGTF